MPEIDGYTLIDSIRDRPAMTDTPIVAVSAQTPSKRPLTSDGIVFLQSGGISVTSMIECLRDGLKLLQRGDRLNRLSEEAPPSPGTSEGEPALPVA